MIDEVLIVKEVEKLLREDNPAGSLSIKEIRNRVAKVLGDDVHKFKDEIKAIVKSFVLTQHLGQHDSLVNLNKDEGKEDVDDDDDDDDDVDKIVYDINDKIGSVAAPWESNYGKLVWVKIYSSFPWWPSIVNDPNSLPIKLKKQATRLIGKKFCISYLGDATFGFPNLSQVRDFDEYYEEFSKQPSKKKVDDDKLQDAIKLALEYKENIQFVKNEPPLKKIKTETNSPKKLKSETISAEKKVVKSPKDKPPKKSPNISSKNTSAQKESKLNKPKEIAKDAPANGHNNNNSNSIITPNKKKKVDNQVRKEEQVDIAEEESASEIEDDAEEDDEDYLSDKQSKRPAVKKVSDENDKSKKRKRDSSESIQERKNNGEEVQSSTGNSVKKRASPSTSIRKSIEGSTSASSAKKVKPSIEKEKAISTPGENKKKKSDKPNLTIEKPSAKSGSSTSSGGKAPPVDKTDKVETPLALATRLVSSLEEALTALASAKGNVDIVLRILEKLKHVKLSLSELQESRALEIVIGLRKHSVSEIAVNAKNLRNYWKQQMVSSVVSTPKSMESIEIVPAVQPESLNSGPAVEEAAPPSTTDQVVGEAPCVAHAIESNSEEETVTVTNAAVTDAAENQMDVVKDESFPEIKTDTQFGVADDKALLSDDKALLGDDKALLGDDKALLGDDKALLGDDKALLGDDKALLGDDKALLGDNKALLGDDKALLGDDKALLGDDKALLGDDKALLGDDDAMDVEEVPPPPAASTTTTAADETKVDTESVEKTEEFSPPWENETLSGPRSRAVRLLYDCYLSGKHGSSSPGSASLAAAAASAIEGEIFGVWQQPAQDRQYYKTVNKIAVSLKRSDVGLGGLADLLLAPKSHNTSMLITSSVRDLIGMLDETDEEEEEVGADKKETGGAESAKE